MKLKFLLIFSVCIYSQCLDVFSPEVLVNMRNIFGSCIIDSILIPGQCKALRGAYKGEKWLEVFSDSLGGIVVFSDTYVYVNKYVHDGSTLMSAQHLCYDSLGVHKPMFFDGKGKSKPMDCNSDINRVLKQKCP